MQDGEEENLPEEEAEGGEKEEEGGGLGVVGGAGVRGSWGWDPGWVMGQLRKKAASRRRPSFLASDQTGPFCKSVYAGHAVIHREVSG